MAEMKAGRELDALVAEKVMGETVRDGWIIDGWDRDGIPNRSHPVEPYSTDIAAAWDVVERLAREKECILRLEVFADPKRCTVELTRPWEMPEWFHGETMPHAIALAALKAVGA